MENTGIYILIKIKSNIDFLKMKFSLCTRAHRQLVTTLVCIEVFSSVIRFESQLQQVKGVWHWSLALVSRLCH